MKYLSTTFHLISALLFMIFILVILSCGSKQEEVIQRYTSGEISRKHHEIRGRKEGQMVEYYKDGKVKGQRLFKNDMQVGKTIFYYPDGKIKEVQYYEEGKLHGGDTLYYENGRQQFVRHFNHGLLDGHIRKWNMEGALIYEAKYANDTLIEVLGKAVHPDSLQQEVMDLN